MAISPCYYSALEKNWFKELLNVAHIPIMLFYPLFVNVDNPTTIVGLLVNGNLSIDQGIPPSLAFIWINILVTIDLKFLPLEIVDYKITWFGTGVLVKNCFFISL